MRVDAHAHASQEDWVADGWWTGLARQAAAILPGVTPELVREHLIPPMFDPDGSAQLGAMEQAGIDVAIVFAFDWSTGPHWGPPAPVGWREQNAWYRDLAAANPGRIRWAFGADPRHPGAALALRRAVREDGAVAVKIHPGNGFDLDDPAVYPAVEAAGELDVPVICHVGPISAPGRSRWAAPERLDTLAASFPEVRFVAAHCGNALWREVLAFCSVSPNVWVDLSGWQIRFQRNPDRFHADVREVLEELGPGRVMWGSDAPHYRPAVPDDEYLRAFTDAPPGTYTAEEVEAITGATAATLFRLPS